MNCCGEERTDNYCGSCGKSLIALSPESPLDRLLRYVGRQARECASYLDRYPGSSFWKEQGDKWSAMEAALRETMNERSGTNLKLDEVPADMTPGNWVKRCKSAAYECAGAAFSINDDAVRRERGFKEASEWLARAKAVREKHGDKAAEARRGD